jgi:hypothetical protein
MSDETNWFNEENYHDYNMDVQGEGDEGIRFSDWSEIFWIV